MHNVLVIAMNRNRKIKRTVIVRDSKNGVRKQNYVRYCGLTVTDKRKKNIEGRRKGDTVCVVLYV